MIVLILIGFGVVLALELPALIKLRSLRDTAAFLVLMSAALLLSILIAMDVSIPSPIRGIQYLLEKVLHITYPPP